jgi:Replication-relaxation
LKQDTGLSWMFYPHRHAIAAVRIAATIAAESVGYGLIWYADEELANLRERTRVQGKATPIRPDGFVVIDPGRQAPCFLEVQLQSEPATYLKKAEAYEAYYLSGNYTTRFGFRALRILGVTDTARRAQSLAAVIERAAVIGLKDMFWSAALPDVIAQPFAPIWYVPQLAERQRLIAPER